MHFRQLPEGGNAVHLPQQVSPKEVGGQLVALEVCRAHPHLSQQPIARRVRGQKHWVLRAGVLLKLGGRRMDKEGKEKEEIRGRESK